MPVYFGDNALNSGDADSLAFNDGSLQTLLTKNVVVASNSTVDHRAFTLAGAVADSGHPTVNLATVITNALALTQNNKANQTIRQNIFDTGTSFGAIMPVSQQYWGTP